MAGASYSRNALATWRLPMRNWRKSSAQILCWRLLAPWRGLVGEQPRYQHGQERYLIVSTTAAAFDGAAQAGLIEAIRTALRESGAGDAKLYGSGVYTADLEASVRREALLFSVLAGGGLVLLLLWRFRSGRVLTAIATPMLAGTAAGFAAVALIHDNIHGIALAFGFTLLGVAVDYPLHLFGHGRSRLVWPTLRLSIASTAVAYGIFLFGGSAALTQLGTFAVCGVFAAGLASAWLAGARLPARTSAWANRAIAGKSGRPLSSWPWLISLAVATPVFISGPSFSDDLARLTPVAPETLAADAGLRARLGASDMRHLVAIRSNSLEAALQATEEVAAALAAARDRGGLASYSHVAQLLPSRRTQQRRHDALVRFVGDEGAALAAAADDLGFTADAFAPFTERAVAASASADFLTPAVLRQDDDLQAFVDAHLYQTADGEWKTLAFLRGIADLGAVRGAVAGVSAAAAELVDLRQSSTSLVADFRQRLLAVLGIALIVIAATVYLSTRNASRTAWVVGTVATALLAAACVAAYARGGMSPFDLMALALVAGLSLDYALFYSKAPQDDRDATDTGNAVLVCALSSLLVFGILALSSIPVLAGIGSTVATGVLAAFLLARFGNRGAAGA